MNIWNLGAAVGLSFQMIQKYEAGLYCIPVSRLFELANTLDVSPSFFFEGPRPRAKDDSVGVSFSGITENLEGVGDEPA